MLFRSWGGYGAGLGVMAGGALLGGIIGGAIANSGGYGYGYGGYPAYYAYPQQYYVPAQPRVRVYNYNNYYYGDDYGW